MDTVPAHPRIPYGEGDFRRIRLRGWLYVDKTRFLRRLEFLSQAIARQTGIRDYIAGEKVIQGFVAAYLSVADYYVFRSEPELGQTTSRPGHADIALEPLVARYPQLRRGYLIDPKYLSRSESAERGRVAASAREATAQLQRYLADERLARQSPGVRFTGLALVFHGWEMVFCDAVA